MGFQNIECFAGQKLFSCMHPFKSIFMVFPRNKLPVIAREGHAVQSNHVAVQEDGHNRLRDPTQVHGFAISCGKIARLVSAPGLEHQEQALRPEQVFLIDVGPHEAVPEPRARITLGFRFPAEGVKVGSVRGSHVWPSVL